MCVEHVETVAPYHVGKKEERRGRREKKLLKDFEADKAREENGEGGGHMCADEASGKVALTSCWCSTTTTINTTTTTI